MKKNEILIIYKSDFFNLFYVFRIWIDLFIKFYKIKLLGI
jgi:hypothetical protein